MNDIFIREQQMPIRFKGFIKLDSDGNYNIYINADLSPESKKRTIRHELEHINKDHFDYDSVQWIESDM